MDILEFSEENKSNLTDEQKKLEKLWSLWEEEKASSPCEELMTYQSEVNNGGHEQYFYNVENTGDLKAEMSILETVLSAKMQKILHKAYDAYVKLMDDEFDEQAAETLEQCDDDFYDCEEEIDRLLQEYASKIEL